MAECPVTPPALQGRYSDRSGFIGRVDFDWPDHFTVGEFDGLAKYRDPGLLGGADPAEVVIREKLREDRLRGLGLTVVRWTFADLRTRHGLCTLLRSAGLPPGHPAS